MVSVFKWAIADWHELVESGILSERRVELLEGEIVEMSPQRAGTHAGPMHSSTNYSVVEHLKELLRGKAVVREAHPITLDNSELEPDVAVVAAPYTNYFTRHPYPQDIYWLIEISNRTLKSDIEKKSVIYARNGIPEAAHEVGKYGANAPSLRSSFEAFASVLATFWRECACDYISG